MQRILFVAALVSFLLAPSLSGAGTADASAVAYMFKSSSSDFEVGCQGPCACPRLIRPIGGSFLLAPSHANAMSTYYDVLEFRATLEGGSAPIPVTGSGTYRVGGEFALTEQMTLDLAIGSQPSQHYDTGAVPEGAPFPAILVSLAARAFACYDSVLVLKAEPGSTGVPGPGEGVSGLVRIQPNPFRSSAQVTLRMSRAGPLELAVMDIAGRRVRTLLSERWMAAEERQVVWDGRRDDGRRAPAGLYWILMLSPDGSDRRRLVRLE
jgi:hypothetical protein